MRAPIVVAPANLPGRHRELQQDATNIDSVSSGTIRHDEKRFQTGKAETAAIWL